METNKKMKQVILGVVGITSLILVIKKVKRKNDE